MSLGFINLQKFLSTVDDAIQVISFRCIIHIFALAREINVFQCFCYWFMF